MALAGDASVARRFGENLRRARHAAGLTQDEMSKRTRLHRSEIGVLERGERMAGIDVAVQIAAAARVEVEDLFEGIAWVRAEIRRGGFQVDRGDSVPGSEEL